MNYSIYRFTLDIHKTKSQVSIPVLYHDTAIQFYISLTDGGKPYYIEDGCRAVFSAKKPDGTELFNDCIIEDNTRIRYDFTKQTTNSEGIMDCEIRLYGTDGHLITTPAFVVVVDPRVIYDSDIIESHPESTSLDNIISSELSRLDAEASRVDAENARVAAEITRIVSETERVDAEAERTDAEAERKANEAERMKAYASMIGSWVAYSLYPDGTDYTWEWSEGQRYIGLCNGKTPPKSKEDFVWSKFVDTGIYIGSGDMPEWCDLQIDPEEDATEIVQTTGQSETDIMSQKAVSNTFSNALKGNASGEVVALNDVSPIEHELGVNVSSKNVFRFTSNTNTTVNGLKITTSANSSSFTVDGTSTNTSFTGYSFTSASMLLPAGTYTLNISDVPFSGKEGNDRIQINGKNPLTGSAEMLVAIYFNNQQKKPTFTITETWEVYINFLFPPGRIWENQEFTVQLEKGTTATAPTPYIEDVSAVTVSAMGKNLLDIHNRTKGTTPSGLNTTQRKLETDKYYVGLSRLNYCYDYHVKTANYIDGVWSIESKLVGYGVTFPVEVKPNTTYCLNNPNIFCGFYDKEGNYISDWVGSRTVRHFTTPSNCAIVTICLSPLDINTLVEYSNCQLELDTTVTAYEPYIEPVTYPVSADGTVEGVKSIYPTTTLLTDTAVAIIDCTYNKDANKAFDDIITRISALEAAVL